MNEMGKLEAGATPLLFIFFSFASGALAVMHSWCARCGSRDPTKHAGLQVLWWAKPSKKVQAFDTALRENGDKLSLYIIIIKKRFHCISGAET